MDQKVKRINRQLLRQGAILDIYTDTMELPNGKTEEWDFISHRKGAAAVVPVREDGKILMVRQYRNAIERMTLEIPAGSRDSVTEETRVCAARELKPGKQHLDEGEFIDVEAHDVDELCEMIYAGKLQDAKTVSAILAYKNLLSEEKNR